MRLIDADALKADYGMKDDCADCDKELRGKSKACEFDRVYTKMDFCGWLDYAPTVDAVPVVRGRWETVEDGDGDEHYKCSVCGAETFCDGDPDDNDYLYCPRCGAKMDGKGNGNETD